MTNRYMTPLKWTDGNGKVRTGQVYFELDPIEFTDWTFANPFEANELRASLMELKDAEAEDSRDMSQDEIRTMLYVIKLLAQLSYGRPTDDGEYFIKDPNWTSSYKYRSFRMLLMTNPKEVQEFLKAILDTDVMDKFTAALAEANAKAEAEDTPRQSDSGEDTVAKMKARIAELEGQTPSTASTDA